MFSVGPMELLLVLILALLIFGPQKIPEIAAGLGQAIREFRRASQEMSEALALNELTAPLEAPPPASPAGPDQTPEPAPATFSDQSAPPTETDQPPSSSPEEGPEAPTAWSVANAPEPPIAPPPADQPATVAAAPAADLEATLEAVTLPSENGASTAEVTEDAPRQSA